MSSPRKPPRKPDYEISALIKGTKISQKLGAIWTNDDGSLHLSFDPFADLNAVRDQGNAVVITAFDRRNEE